MDMIEKVAKAMAASDEAEPLMACACMGKKNHDDPACACKMYAARRRARAAIAAMREPTEAMLKAGEEGINSLPALPGHYAEYCWPAMIDAALSSPPVAEETK